MTRFLLDTNIISNAVKVDPSPHLIRWLSQQPDQSLFISSFTLAEIRRGILEKPEGRKRRVLEAWFDGPDGPAAMFAGRILAFDSDAALAWARLMAECSARGRPRSALDMIIAAVAEAGNLVIVTDNERHFEGLNILNPMRGNGPPDASE